MDDIVQFLNGFALPIRAVFILLLSIATHLLVLAIRFSVDKLLQKFDTKRFHKIHSVATLATSTLIFTLYFFAFGLILREFGVSLSTYLASASVVGLAIGFGLQGVVQDVVSGITFIFSNLLDVGDLVTIGDKTGIVKAITMRFVELEDAMGASIFVPNRTITNISVYPRGYVRCIADITLTGDSDAKEKMCETAQILMESTCEQFPGIIIKDPSVEGRKKLKTGKELFRLKFRIWPNRGTPIETSFLQELTAALKKIDASYQPWMVAISYEVERSNKPVRSAFGWSKSR